MKYIKVLWLVLALALSQGAMAGPVSASGTITTQNVSSSETCTAASCVELDITDKGTVSVQVAGTYTGALTLQRSNDRITWATLSATTTFTNAAGTATATIASGTEGTFAVANVAGFKWVRVTALAAVTGSATVTIYTSIPGGGGGGGSAGGGLTDAELRATAVPISAASLPLPSTAATSTKQSDGSQKTQVVDGSGNVIAATSNALHVHVASGGAGGGDVTGSIAHDAAGAAVDPVLTGCYGSAAAPSDVSATNDAVRAWCLLNGARAVQPTFAGVLGVAGNGVAGTGVQRVTIASDSTGQVALAAGSATIGALTANQSVNVAQINGVTPLMGSGATGTGSHRVTAATDSPEVTALQIMDDWDESDRAKVNPIAGQAGVAAGSGTISASTQRVTIATDDVMSAAIVGVAHDAAGAAVNPALVGCYASAAAPSDVSADNDATRAWCLRNGSRAVTPTFAGVLPSTGLGASDTGTQRVATAAYASSAAVTLTRTADTNAYAANDVLGAATGSTAALTFASMCPVSGGNIMLTTVAFEVDATAVISGETSYRLYLYNVTPPSALGDNAAFDLPSGDRTSFLGYVDLGTPVDLGSTLYVQTTGVNKQLKCSGTSLFGYLVTVGAYTPTSARVHVVTLNAVGL